MLLSLVLCAKTLAVTVANPYRESDQLSPLLRVCNLCLPLLTTLQSLNIQQSEYPGEQGNIENMRWLQLLCLFTAAKDQRLSGEVVPLIAVDLQELVGERVTTVTVLPALQNIFVPQQWLFARPSRPVCVAAFEQFTAVRQLYGHPVAVLRNENGG